jgi:hypothetical protein
MTWNGILAAVGGLLFLVGLFSYAIATIADGYDQGTRDTDQRRQFRYGFVHGVTGTLVAIGIIAVVVGLCGS